MKKLKIINYRRIFSLMISGAISLSFSGCGKKNSSNYEASRPLVNSEYSNIIEETVLVDSSNEEKYNIFISNIDSEDGTIVEGTILSIVNNNGMEVMHFMTKEEAYSINLSEGTYTVKTIKNAEGYETINNPTFTINKSNGTVITILNNKKVIELSYEESKNEESVSTIKKNEKNVVEFLEDLDDKINDNLLNAKDKIVEYYEIVYDFIFNDGEIKGYTFNEVQDITKAKAMSLYLKIDETINNKFPDYKDKIKQKYGSTKDKVKEKLSEYKDKLEDYIVDEIGQEKYDSFIDKKDEVIDATKEQLTSDVSDLKELGNNLKEKVKQFIKER